MNPLDSITQRTTINHSVPSSVKSSKKHRDLEGAWRNAKNNFDESVATAQTKVSVKVDVVCLSDIAPAETQRASADPKKEKSSVPIVELTYAWPIQVRPKKDKRDKFEKLKKLENWIDRRVNGDVDLESEKMMDPKELARLLKENDYDPGRISHLVFKDDEFEECVEADEQAINVCSEEYQQYKFEEFVMWRDLHEKVFNEFIPLIKKPYDPSVDYMQGFAKIGMTIEDLSIRCLRRHYQSENLAMFREALHLRGRLLYLQSNYEVALNDYNALIRLGPKEFIALRSRAIINYEIGRYDKASKDLKRAFRLNKKDPTVQCYMAAVSFMLYFSKAKDDKEIPSEPIEFLKNFIGKKKYFHEQPLALLLLAEIYFHKNLLHTSVDYLNLHWRVSNPNMFPAALALKAKFEEINRKEAEADQETVDRSKESLVGKQEPAASGPATSVANDAESRLKEDVAKPTINTANAAQGTVSQPAMMPPSFNNSVVDNDNDDQIEFCANNNNLISDFCM